MYTTHHPCWDAKNRHDLPMELPFEYGSIAHCITTRGSQQPHQQTIHPRIEEPPVTHPVKPETPKEQPQQQSISDIPKNIEQPQPLKEDLSGIPKALADLMAKDNVKVEEIQKAVSSKGYYPENTPIENYDPDFVSGVLVAAWPQVFQMIQEIREDDVPF